MFRNWLAIFKGNTLMDRAYKRSFKMLDTTREMYMAAQNTLRHTHDIKMDVNIRNKDVEINQYEREVRRDVFNHLAVRGIDDLTSGLILISIIIDIERIGDYTKNIVDLTMNHPDKLHGGKFEDELVRVERAVEDNFVRTKNCFQHGNSETAGKLLDEYQWVNRVCDNSLMGLVKEEDKSISAGDAASLALYFRWLKRINSHLRNITTSVVNPFDRIGFTPKNK
ncbi:MAG: PhoU domain-containing protein [Calditrichia bacterium]